MSLFQTQQAADVHDQFTILVGSAIRLLGGECGVFAVSNDAFDPQSSSEYTGYRLNEMALPLLLSHVQKSIQPNLRNPLIVEKIAPELALALGIDEESSCPTRFRMLLTTVIRSYWPVRRTPLPETCKCSFALCT